MKTRRDKRLFSLLFTICAIGILGGIITLIPQPRSLSPTPVTEAALNITAEGSNLETHKQDARSREIEMRFQQAIAMLHANQYDYAVKALNRVLQLSPRLVEAHVNMGYALIGLEEYSAAYNFFSSATELKPEQVNAYYGMAIALEGMNDLPGALGAMRAYIHLSRDENQHLDKARAAIWEWEQALKEATPQETHPAS